MRKGKIKKVCILFMTFLCIRQVKAITSNEVTYDNEGTTENLTDTLDTLYSELKKYKTGGSVEANQMLEGATGYSKGELVTGTIKSKGATTYIPGTSNQTIASGQYLSGIQTIKGDANLIAGNIASGKSIFGISGTFTSDANAVAGNLLKDKTAYVNGSKITGTIGSKGAATYTPGTSNQTISSGQYLSGTQTIKGDANLKAENIKSGVSIFGVTGTYSSSIEYRTGTFTGKHGIQSITFGTPLSGVPQYVSITPISGSSGSDYGIVSVTSTTSVIKNKTTAGFSVYNTDMGWNGTDSVVTDSKMVWSYIAVYDPS